MMSTFLTNVLMIFLNGRYLVVRLHPLHPQPLFSYLPSWYLLTLLAQKSSLPSSTGTPVPSISSGDKGAPKTLPIRIQLNTVAPLYRFQSWVLGRLVCGMVVQSFCDLCKIAINVGKYSSTILTSDCLANKFLTKEAAGMDFLKPNEIFLNRTLLSADIFNLICNFVLGIHNIFFSFCFCYCLAFPRNSRKGNRAIDSFLILQTLKLRNRQGYSLSHREIQIQ